MTACDGCGFDPGVVVAAEVAARIGEAAVRYRPVLLPADRERGWAATVAERPRGDVWSPLEYACHIRDVTFVIREHLYRALTTAEPVLPPMGRDERVGLAAYADEDPAEVLDQLEVGARLLARSFAVLPRDAYERTWSRYDDPTVRTVTGLGAHAVHELVHHWHDIAAVLAPAELGLDHVRRSPVAVGRVDLVAVRPAVDERLVLDEAVLDVDAGVVGDTWTTRPSRRTPDRSPSPRAQVAVMNSRAAALLAGDRSRWALAGDQLYVDLDLSEGALVPGTRLGVGDAVIEVTDEPHRGCHKFAARFGRSALRLVNSAEGRALRLRGVNTRVVTGGVVRQGDEVRVL